MTAHFKEIKRAFVRQLVFKIDSCVAKFGFRKQLIQHLRKQESFENDQPDFSKDKPSAEERLNHLHPAWGSPYAKFPSRRF